MAQARDSLVYAVPFICGDSDRAAARSAADAPVTPGRYATSIQIQNPDAGRKVKFALTGTAHVGDEAPLVGKGIEVELVPRGVMHIDGTYIRNELLKVKAGPAIEPPLFIIGLVTVDTEPAAPLHIVTVYTSHGFAPGGAANGFSMEVQRTEGTLIEQPKPRK